MIAEIPYTRKSEDLNRAIGEFDRGALIAKFTYKFAKKYNLKIVIAGKRPPTKIRDRRRLGNKSANLKSIHNIEHDVYKKILGKKIKIITNDPSIYSSYKAAYSSKVIIGGSSTLLREMLGAGKKILVWRPDSKKGRNFPLNGICSLKSKSYEDFEAVSEDVYLHCWHVD